MTLSFELDIPESLKELVSIEYQWQKSDYDEDEEDWYYTDLDGETGSQLVLNDVTESAEYRCFYYVNHTGSKTKGYPVYFSVNCINGAIFTTHDMYCSISSPEDIVNIPLQIHAVPGTEVTIEWAKEGDSECISKTTETAPESGIIQKMYEVTGVETKTRYICRAYDAEKNGDEVYITVGYDTGLYADTTYYYYEIHEYMNQAMTLAPNVHVNDDYTLSYNWYVNGVPVPDNNAATMSYFVTGEASIICIVTDGRGNEVAIYYSFYDDGSKRDEFGQIIRSNGDDLLLSGQTRTLTCEGTNSDRTFQWQTRGAYDEDMEEYIWNDIPGATSSSYVASTAGYYRVRVMSGDDSWTDSSYLVCGGVNGGSILAAGARQVSVTAPYSYTYFSFVPAQTAEYKFYSSAYANPDQASDSYGVLYDSDMKMIDYDDDSGDGDDGEGAHFCITRKLVAGKQYYLGVRFYIREKTGEMTIQIEGPGFTQQNNPPVAPVTPVTPDVQNPPATSETPETPATPATPVAVTNKKPVVASNGGTVKTTAKGEASLCTVKKTTKKSIKVDSTVSVGGVKYKVTTVNASAFKNAKKATTVTLPDSVTKINANAFKGSKIQTVKIKVKKGAKLVIDKNAFKGSKVKKVEVTISKKATAKEKKAIILAFKKAKITGKKLVIKKK